MNDLKIVLANATVPTAVHDRLVLDAEHEDRDIPEQVIAVLREANFEKGLDGVYPQEVVLPKIFLPLSIVEEAIEQLDERLTDDNVGNVFTRALVAAVTAEPDEEEAEAPSSPEQKLGERIHGVLTDAGSLTSQELADELDVTPRTVNKYENQLRKAQMLDILGIEVGSNDEGQKMWSIAHEETD